MLKDITFGQYVETDSPIHKADPRVKIVLLILAIVFIFISANMWALLLSLGFVLIVALVSKVPIKMYLKNLKAILGFSFIVNAPKQLSAFLFYIKFF